MNIEEGFRARRERHRCHRVGIVSYALTVYPLTVTVEQSEARKAGEFAGR
jgi:hypothetical protein